MNTDNTAYTNHILYATTDGGNSWKEIKKVAYTQIKPTVAAFEERVFFSDGNRLHRTEDNGATWQVVDSLIKERESIHIQKVGSDTIAVKRVTYLYDNNPQRTYLQFSYDKGNTWNIPYKILYKSLNPADLDITFLNTSLAVIIDKFSNNTSHFSIDGGRSFKSAPMGGGAVFQPDFSFSNAAYIDNEWYYYHTKPSSEKINANTATFLNISSGVEYIMFVWKNYFMDVKDEIYFAFHKNGDKAKGMVVYVLQPGTNTFMQINTRPAFPELFNSVVPVVFDFPNLSYNNRVFSFYMPGENFYESIPHYDFGQPPVSLKNGFAGFNNGDISSVAYLPASTYLKVSGPANSMQLTDTVFYAVGKSIYRKYVINSQLEDLGLPGSELRDVNFIDNYNGTVVGDNCEIYSTINSGDFWTTSYKPIIKISGLTGAYFTNDTIGYAISANALYQTTTGGFIWKAVATASFGENNKLFVLPDNSYAFVVSKSGALYKVDITGKKATNIASGVKDFYFFNNNDGYYISENQFFKTSDGGTNWTSIYQFSGISLNAVSFADFNNGYVGGNVGKLLKTTDGGLTWNDVSVAGVNINGLSVVSADTVFVGADKGTFFHSFNGGVNWTPRATGTTDSLHHIKFFNSKDGYLVTSKGFIKTTDGGKNFTLYEAPIKNNLANNPIRFEVGYKRKSSSLYVINNSFKDFIYVNDINVLRNPEYVPNQGGGIVSVGKIDKVGDFSVMLYPNPNNGNFNIMLNNRNSERVTLALYNYLGQKVFEESFMGSGEVKKEIDISSLHTGIYILKVQIGSQELIKKVVKN